MATLIIRGFVVGSLIVLAACGGGGGGSGSNTYTIGGSISGLDGTVVLQNNGGNALSLSSNGSFTFTTALADDADYDVTVRTQPTGPNQICAVTNGSGSVNGAKVTNVRVICTTSIYDIGGTISGLDGTVLLQNNGGDNLSRSANGGFTFATALADGSDYEVSVLTQPTGPNQTCVASNNTGTVSGAAVTNVSIACTTSTYSVGGTISGLAGTVKLRNNGGDELARSANGGFTFATPVTDGTGYDITVSQQPSGQVCAVSNEAGTLNGSAVTNVTVSCLTSHSVGGTVSGLSGTGTVVLQNNGADDLPVSANGSFTFATEVAEGGDYEVEVLTQPIGPNQTCVATSNTGTNISADVTNVSIVCTTNTYTVGGTISGLTDTVVLQNNLGDDLTINADGSFTFATAVTDGQNYNVTILTQPADQICAVSDGSGTLAGADVSGVTVNCLNSYSIGGTIDGLVGTVKLQNNGGDDLSLSADGAFTFAAEIADGSGYAVTVQTQPVGQVCTVSSGAGTASADVDGITVACAQSLTLTPQGIKIFRFSWTDVDGETEYRLLEDPDGVSGYTEIASPIAANETSYDLEVSLPGRINARYILEACIGTDCKQSAPAIVSGTLVEAVGYIKASNTGANDTFGAAVALSADGSTLAVGAPFQDATDSGAVYVFARSGSIWSPQAYIKASNAGASDFFGVAVALAADGATLAVGAPGESSSATGIDDDQTNNAAPSAGAVYVYTRSGNTWTQQAYLKASNTEEGDSFGTALALSGDGSTLAVGATGEDSAATGIDNNEVDDCPAVVPATGIFANCAMGSGAVYVFTRDDITLEWDQEAYVKASNTRPSDLDESTGQNPEDDGDNFGNALALSDDGDTLAVAALHEHNAISGINGNEAGNSVPYSGFIGAVYVFSRSGPAWSQQAYVKASNNKDVYLTSIGQYWFGSSLSLAADGNTLAVGAQHEDSASTGVGGIQVNNQAQLSGAVYVFTRDDITLEWSQEAYVKASNTGTGDFFGSAVALAGDGNTLAVGAYSEDSAATGIGGDQLDNSAGNAGAVYVFTRDDITLGWSQQAYVKASNTEAADSFGQALALSEDGGILAAGARLEKSGATDIGGDQTRNDVPAAGAVYLY